MRRFSDSEKRTITTMVRQYMQNPSQYILVNAYNDIFFAKKVEFNTDNPDILTFFRNRSDYELLEDVQEVIQQILETSLLIKYLIKSDLIYLLETNSVNRLTKIGGFLKEDNDVPITANIDSLASEILVDSLYHSIFISETLKVLVEDNFLTTEDKLLQANERLSIDTMNLSRDTLDQKKEIEYQTEVTIKLHKQAVAQSVEAKRLADEAHEQTAEARKQTKVAKRQTWLSIGALILSIGAIIASYLVARFVTMDVHLIESQYNKIIQPLDNLTQNQSDSVFIKNETIDVNIKNNHQLPLIKK